MKDHYQALGVSKKATDDEIKRAFRKLARQYHPDKNPNNPAAEKRFKEFSEAYEVLGDPPKRLEYDEQVRLGAMGAPAGFRGQAGHAGHPGGAAGQPGFGGFGGIDDLLGSFFRNASGGGGRGVSKGADVEVEAEVSLEEAIAGTSLTLNVTGGSAPRRLRVPIPAGVATGTRVRVPGEGEQSGNGGEPGDLFVKVSVKGHGRFERDGDNLLLNLPVSVFDAVLGAEVTVPTIDGEVKLKLPPGTQGGQVFRLKNKGVPQLKGANRGALLVTVMLQIPKAIGPAERALWAQLAERDHAPGHQP